MLTQQANKTSNSYVGVRTRFLHRDERLIASTESEMPLVIEAKERTDIQFLQEFLKNNSEKLIEDAAKYGALLFRGFDIQTDKDFEDSILSINGLHGISEAFMAEHGRERVGDLKYVLHTNTIYKTGGTLYLGGFHSENYYSPDVPAYISFCCLNPSTIGGETGLVNLEKAYEGLSDGVKKKLEEKPFFVNPWLVTDIAERYKIEPKKVEEICAQFDLPIEGEGENRLVLMHKPSVFLHPITQKKALAINFFSLPTLDHALRKCFMDDYKGKTWFWHRLFWKFPFFKTMENMAVFCISLFHSPKELFQIAKSKKKTQHALNMLNKKFTKVNSCFSKEDIDQLAKSMRASYGAAIWKKGDILLVDNRKVAHTGMPGSGPRVIRALITNPQQMGYSSHQPGCLSCQDRASETSIAELITKETR